MTPDNMKEYRASGAVGFGIGTNIVDKKLLAEGDFDGIAALARQYVEAAAL